jgi:hypothetical protein
LSVITRSARTPWPAKKASASGHEPDSRGGPFVGMDPDERHPGRIVDRDMEIVMAEAQPVAGGLTEHPVTAARWDPAEFLDVDVDEFAGSLAHIADGHPGQSIGLGQPADAVAKQDGVHRRARMVEQGPPGGVGRRAVGVGRAGSGGPGVRSGPGAGGVDGPTGPRVLLRLRPDSGATTCTRSPD